MRVAATHGRPFFCKYLTHSRPVPPFAPSTKTGLAAAMACLLPAAVAAAATPALLDA